MDRSYYNKIKSEIPKISGVYIFKDAAKRPLYVGKANNLSNRLKSYFMGPKVPMIAQMLIKASSINWETTLTEIEALILESQLIKKLKPPYNTLMRDDKQYFYVGFTSDIFPRIVVTHQVSSLKTKNSKLKTDFVGPFTDGGGLRLALKNLRKVFPYCTCKQKHHRLCLNYHIGNCLGFCCLKERDKRQETRDKQEYQKNIQAIKEILSGKKTALVQKLIKELKQKEAVADFEYSTKLRNQITKLERFFQNTKIIKNFSLSRKTLVELKKVLGLSTIPKRIEGYDISNIGGLFATGSMVVFTNGIPDKNEYRKFKINPPVGGLTGGDTGMLREVLERRLRHREWQYPDLILVDGGRGQISAARAALKYLVSSIKYQVSEIPIIGITKDAKHRGERVTLENKRELSLSSLPDSVRNLLLNVDAEAHRFAISYYRKRHSFK